jgi:hypothetical protein
MSTKTPALLAASLAVGTSANSAHLVVQSALETGCSGANAIKVNAT